VSIQDYFRRYFAGPRKPVVMVRIEEIEKALAGVETETSGTAGDALGTFLTAMEDFRWTGLLAYGVSGCGKSLVAKAVANEFGAKAIRFDLNACRGSLVGESERQIRAVMNVLHAIGGDRVFFIASMNKIKTLPPELRRRFAAGTWFFDVLSAEGRKNAWDICARQFDVPWDGYDRDQLTGSDIRDIVQRSYELGCTTTEASAYHVPLANSAPDAIDDARKDAEGRYLDAEHGGPYRRVRDSEASGQRQIEVM
jgi:SpoVK/Ycf46/Vps4 family AAA+-type ATPase